MSGSRRTPSRRQQSALSSLATRSRQARQRASAPAAGGGGGRGPRHCAAPGPRRCRGEGGAEATEKRGETSGHTSEPPDRNVRKNTQHETHPSCEKITSAKCAEQSTVETPAPLRFATGVASRGPALARLPGGSRLEADDRSHHARPSCAQHRDVHSRSRHTCKDSLPLPLRPKAGFIPPAPGRLYRLALQRRHSPWWG